VKAKPDLILGFSLGSQAAMRQRLHVRRVSSWVFWREVGQGPISRR